MKRILVLMCLALGAQAQRPAESLSGWQFYKEVQIPRIGDGLLDFVLDRDMLTAARVDNGDVRLYDASGREMAYVRRVRNQVDTSGVFTAREFNRGTEGRVAQVSYDLGERVQPHNEVVIDTAGSNFRRLAEVEGSSDGVQWATLMSKAILFRFGAGGRTVEQESVTYPVSRYRYLRIRVSPDPAADEQTPEVKNVQVRHSIRLTGELISFPGQTEPRSPDRQSGRPASIWRVDLGGRIPIQRVIFTTADLAAFSRPFQLEDVDDPGSPYTLASGELSRPEGSTEPRLQVDFSERYARHLKLTVTDDRNPPLTIGAATVQGAAREVIFPARAAGTGPVKVYYGNHKALPPRYDLQMRLPAEIVPPPVRVALSAQRDNPIYSPEPRPFSERAPWLVYIVLGAAAVALVLILLSIVGEPGNTTRADPAQPTPTL